MKHTKKICALSVTAALSLALAAPAAAADYTVQRGDSLWEIAREQLGDGTRWGELYAANRDTVRDPSLIYAGQVLKIPGSGEGTAPSAPAEETMPAVESTTRTEKALALIRTFATGDTETAARLLDENYIQHNLAYGTGECWTRTTSSTTWPTAPGRPPSWARWSTWPPPRSRPR